MASAEKNSATSHMPEVREYLRAFQDRVCEAVEAADEKTRFRHDEIEREGGGHSRPRVLEDGEIVERAAVNFSETSGLRLPSPQRSAGRNS